MRVYLTVHPDTGRRIWRRNTEQAADEQRALGLKVSGFTAVLIPDAKDAFLDWLNEQAAGPAQPVRAAPPVMVQPSIEPAAGREFQPIADLGVPAGSLADALLTPPLECGPGQVLNLDLDPPFAIPLVNVTAVVDQILVSQGAVFGRYVRAAVRRLGTLGDRGRAAVKGACRPGDSFIRGAGLAGVIALAELAAEREGISG